MKIERMMAGVYGANCFIVSDEETKTCFIIDPGGDADDIEKYLVENDLTPKFILLTHGHGDHIAGIPILRRTYDIPVWIHEEEDRLLQDPQLNMSLFMPITPVGFRADRLLKDKETISEGHFVIKVHHSPGHTRGSCCYKMEGHLFTGDTLFYRSIGRTDLVTGSPEDMEHTLEYVLYPMGDKLIVHSGHGQDSTMGDEKEHNLFFKKYRKRG
ncbi:MAG: MBL fold metallo-hydrolase [Tissierellia bacterium]|nr:MBL fold metallo-hydrolase [Tissierellia bacterium]